MAEVRKIPQWVALEALRNNVAFLRIETSDGSLAGVVDVAPEDFTVSTQDYDPFLKLSIPKTIEVDGGDTITDILLYIEGTNAPTVYGADDHDIQFPIVDVDGNGEYFPDGGSIDVTEFVVNLDDL